MVSRAHICLFEYECCDTSSNLGEHDGFRYQWGLLHMAQMQCCYVFIFSAPAVLFVLLGSLMHTTFEDRLDLLVLFRCWMRLTGRNRLPSHKDAPSKAYLRIVVSFFVLSIPVWSREMDHHGPTQHRSHHALNS